MKLSRRNVLEAGIASAALGGCAYPRRGALPPDAKLRGRIEHFVVLMMENRSYDQMLGALPGAQYEDAGAKEGTLLSYRDAHGETRSVPLRYGVPRDSFYPDPPHRYPKVIRQIEGDMGGFAQVFSEEHALAPSLAASVAEYATCYADGQLPILQTLAREYGVCTRWFSSLPGPTTPNRMFAHAGTSAGTVAQGAYYSRVRGKMIFDVLGQDQALWRVYYHDLPHLYLTGDLWTKTFSGHLRRIGRFARDVMEDQLPVYTFIEPRHVIPPWNSQHPFMGVSHGEELIARVYNDLVANPRVFEKTLFLIVYDEHGGFYDHVVPPSNVIAPSGASPEGFDFTRLGVRVPAVVVSPWIERGSAFPFVFDHTSILATASTMTNRWVGSARARAALPLDVVVNRMAPRTDASKLTFRGDVYHHRVASPTYEPAGVAKEIVETWIEDHGRDATPEQIVGYWDELVTP